MAARGVIVCLQKSNPKYFHRTYCSVRNELQKEHHRLKSTTATVVESADDVEGVKYQKDALDLTFENAKDAYKSKTTWELIRAFMVLKLSTYDYLVENNQKRLRWPSGRVLALGTRGFQARNLIPLKICCV
ncbi:hypothetical protein AVEN_21080-1 [Araneus ventricosus]|uniref:Uncharacterized protein n=1 Tax=Araneus ventricosus TaxID=182803 RepID=A0A4Y2FNC1_ARAVE|nr:hypothetical protein AVEN_21080-1 [Araneus ventricosus]